MASSLPILCFPIEAMIVKKILVILVPLLAFFGGAFGGDLLHSGKQTAKSVATAGGDSAETGETAAEADHPEASAETGATSSEGHGESGGDAALDWYKFPNQFFVPILRNGTPTAVMVLSLTVEMPATSRSVIETQEHRLRDSLLNALMIEANTGGFDGNFTAEPAQQRLRAALLIAAQKTAGPAVKRILIEDIGRQEQ